MKNFLNLILLSLVFTGSLLGQCTNNPSIQAGNISPAPLVNGQGATLSMTFVENLFDYTDDENNPVGLNICLQNVGPANGINSVGGTYADHFDWVYSASLNCLQGTQNQDILGGDGGTITVDFIQTNSIACPDNQMGFKAEIIPPACMMGVNETIDDNEQVYVCNSTVAVPTLSIGDYVFDEDAGEVEVSVCLSDTLSEDVQVDYNMADVTTSVGADYSAAFTGTLNIPAGERCAVIKINIIDDSDVESTESFTINLTNSVNADISDASGVVRINDNDVACAATAPTLSKN